MFYLAMFFLLFGVPSIVMAQSHFYSLSLFASNEYTDNLYLSKTNKKDDFVSNLGVLFSATRATRVSSLNFSYSLSRSFYWSQNKNDSFRHNLSLNYNKKISRKLSFNTNTTYYRTEEPIEPDSNIFEDRQGERRPYYRINSSANISYEYWKNSFIKTGASINYLQNEDPTVEDSRIYSEFISISRDVVKYFSELRFSATQREFETTPSVETWQISFSQGYKITHNKSLSLNISLDKTQDKAPQGEDYKTYSTDLNYNWSPTKKDNYHFSIGYFWKVSDEKGKDEDGIKFSIAYTKRFKLTSYSLTGSGGYRYQYGEAQNLGFTKYYNLSFSVTRKLSKRMSGSTNLFYRWEDNGTLSKHTYGASLNLNRTLTKKLTASLSYSYREVKSDDPADEYKVNSIFLKINYMFWQGKEFPWF
ncbi:hypothetical protein Thein_1223 [Thermodesulfatator indicus DSM 15286]|uniref:PEP-CTERM system associated protein n=1 Tax=Thermodesulfatator indicus (strain DSM 15286 / JCM 11887 / CIR29812) TaxID=667014 RepID=F8A8K5_THEID|nr:hypothetical protein [Thermodesulfatator indicus]AEH45091.1 hypothetical protein Thein_1223 [Thermodesulfatator indicus DSM 15286]